jgi:hypothetical protein
VGDAFDAKPLRDKVDQSLIYTRSPFHHSLTSLLVLRQVAEVYQLSEMAATGAGPAAQFVMNERACVRLLEFDFLREVLRDSDTGREEYART